MTNKNSTLNCNNQKNLPFLLKPSAKDYLWGGTRLNDEFKKDIPLFPLAETWECSTHKDGDSFANSGEFKGKTLSEILREKPFFLGTNSRTVGELPILVKLIDATDDLSIQVHPNDEYAKQHEGENFGKTELWYVLDAEQNSKLVYGLHTKTDKQTLKKSIENGDTLKFMSRYNVSKNDVFFIKPGTVHALGKGILIAEIQQSSNLTYRLYDYDRKDKDGKKRELHIKKALDVANLDASEQLRQPVRLLRYKKGYAFESLCRCEYFKVDRLLLNNKYEQDLNFATDNTSFRVLLSVEGTASLKFLNTTLKVNKGDCVFIPSDSVEISMSGKAVFLDISC